MPHFNEIPYLRLLIAFLLGILLAHHTIDQLFELSSFLYYFLLIPIVPLFFWRRHKTSSFLSMVILVSFALLGCTRYYLAIPQQSEDYYGHMISNEASQTLEVKVNSSPVTGKNLRIFANVESIQNQGTFSSTRGELLLYFNIDSIPPDIRYGDKLIIYTRPQEVRSNDNPLAFNYDDYLRNRNVYYQAYVGIGKWTLAERSNNWNIKMLANHLRLYCNEVISTYVDGADNQAIASAMLLGYRNNLSNEIYDAYTDTGAVHVLAVSGLHVSIVNLFLILLLRWWPTHTIPLKIAKSVVIVAGIWLFTLVTGAAPAVARAATMFTLFTFGFIFYRRINIYNVLCFSALLLLVIDPKYILQGSFQFSYLALLSIVFFHPIIKRWYSSKNKALQYLWNLIVVALSAQVLVFPVTIFYFHKFALSFWLSGIFAVVLAMFVIGFGLLLFLTSLISTFLSIWIGKLLSSVLSIFIFSIKSIQRIPYSTLNDLWLDLPQMLTLYGCLLLLMMALGFKKRKLWIAILILLNIFVIQRIRFAQQSTETREIIVYDSNQNLIIDFIKGDERVTIKSKGTPLKNEQFVAANYRLSKGLSHFTSYTSDSIVDNKLLYQNGSFISFEDKLLYLQQGELVKWKAPIAVDILIIDQIKTYDLDKLLSYVKPSEIILTHHMKNWQIRKIRKDLESNEIPYRYVGDKAIIIDLS